eukprot:GHVQ01033569.1.p1 GENE.GHVQ01033569.1~~GHVQ01033569.1.p1  ORF type:complete len:785 (-),score=80.37 GHVQ01033569.1:287-2641(-)
MAHGEQRSLSLLPRRLFPINGLAIAGTVKSIEIEILDLLGDFSFFGWIILSLGFLLIPGAIFVLLKTAWRVGQIRNGNILWTQTEPIACMPHNSADRDAEANSPTINNGTRTRWMTSPLSTINHGKISPRETSPPTTINHNGTSPEENSPLSTRNLNDRSLWEASPPSTCNHILISQRDTSAPSTINHIIISPRETSPPTTINDKDRSPEKTDPLSTTNGTGPEETSSLSTTNHHERSPLENSPPPTIHHKERSPEKTEEVSRGFVPLVVERGSLSKTLINALGSLVELGKKRRDCRKTQTMTQEPSDVRSISSGADVWDTTQCLLGHLLVDRTELENAIPPAVLADAVAELPLSSVVQMMEEVDYVVDYDTHALTQALVNQRVHLLRLAFEYIKTTVRTAVREDRERCAAAELEQGLTEDMLANDDTMSQWFFNIIGLPDKPPMTARAVTSVLYFVNIVKYFKVILLMLAMRPLVRDKQLDEFIDGLHILNMLPKMAHFIQDDTKRRIERDLPLRSVFVQVALFLDNTFADINDNLGWRTDDAWRSSNELLAKLHRVRFLQLLVNTDVRHELSKLVLNCQVPHLCHLEEPSYNSLAEQVEGLFSTFPFFLGDTLSGQEPYPPAQVFSKLTSGILNLRANLDTEAHIDDARVKFRRLKCLNRKVRALRAMIEWICGHYNHTVSIDKLMSGLFGILVCRMWTTKSCHTYSEAEIRQDRELLSIYYNEGLQAVRRYKITAMDGEPMPMRLNGGRPEVRLGSAEVESDDHLVRVCLHVVVGADIPFE